MKIILQFAIVAFTTLKINAQEINLAPRGTIIASQAALIDGNENTYLRVTPQGCSVFIDLGQNYDVYSIEVKSNISFAWDNLLIGANADLFNGMNDENINEIQMGGFTNQKYPLQNAPFAMGGSVSGNSFNCRYIAFDGLTYGLNASEAFIYEIYVNGVDATQQITVANNGMLTSPANLDLKLLTNNISRITISNSNGNVSIGATPTNYKLTVTGDIYADGGWLKTSGNNGLYFESYGGGLYMSDPTWIRTFGSKNFLHEGEVMLTTGSIQVGAYGGDRFVVTKSGTVGIGTSTPNKLYKLDVAGSIRANEITVNTTGADFVFEPTYKLRTLNEVETYIKQNKHLPDVAPATKMQANGVSMGEMQAKLLQKLEELTLYVIEQQKTIEKQNQRIAELEKTSKK